MKFVAEYTGEVEVNLSIQELLIQLPGMDTPTSEFEAKQLVSRCHACLKYVPDELVAAMAPAARRIIATALREQAARYDPPPP